MKGVKSHQIIRDGLAMLENLTHRGAVGSDPLMGDGAGLLAQIPDRFFREELAKHGITLPPPGHYGIGYLFMPQDTALCAHIEGIIREVTLAEGQTLLGFRDVPVDNSSLSTAPHIAAAEPIHRQVFIGRSADIATEDEFERRLYILRKVISGAHPCRDQRRRQWLLHRVDVGAHHRLQGHVPRLSGRLLLQGPRRSAFRERAGR